MSFDAMLGKSLMREMREQGMTIHQYVVPAARASSRVSKPWLRRTAASLRASIACCGESGAPPTWPASISARRRQRR
jgi:hypothetical protein